MSITIGKNNGISRNGLILYVNPFDTNSNKGAPTTNLLTASVRTCDGGLTSYFDPKLVEYTNYDKGYKSIKIQTSASNGRRDGVILPTGLAYASASVFSLGVDVWVPSGSAIQPGFRFYGGAGPVGEATVMTYHGKSYWERIVYNGYSILDDTTNVAFQLCETSSASSQSLVFYIKNPQLESSSFATPFVNGTRTGFISQSGGLYDISIQKFQTELSNMSFTQSNGLVLNENSNNYFQFSSSLDTSLENFQEGNHTMIVWYYPFTTPNRVNTNNNRHAIMMKQGFHMGISFNGLYSSYVYATPTTVTSLTVTGSGLNTWDCIGYTYDRMNLTNGYKLFKNGIPVQQTNAVTSSREYGTNPLRIGRAANPTGPAGEGETFPGGFSWVANGKIGCCLVYERALSENEMYNIYYTLNRLHQ